MKIIITTGHFLRSYSLLMAIFLSGVGLLQAQERELQGVVTAEELPLMGVAVQIEGTDTGTTTNIDGEYHIKVHSGDTLRFSHLGYKTLKILITNQSTLDITLESDATALDVVEISGYYSLDERTKTGNVAVVGRDQLDQQVIHAPLEALQGRVAGLEIETISGVSGQNPRITIRGRSSLRSFSDTPLYIIDGIPINNEKYLPISQVYDLAGGIDPLSTLDPSLIESIEVLKDADATAIYGSRGANGVIIINTKRGKAGKTKLEVQAETGVSWVGKFMKLMNTEQYLEMRREAFANDGVEPTEANAPDLLLWDQNRYTDWQKELIGHHAEFQKYQGTLSGGNQQTSFLLSGGFQKETTVFPGDFGFQNNNLLANINHRSLNNKLSLNTSINYGYRKNHLFNAGLYMANGIVLPPNSPSLYDDDGNINWEIDNYGNPTFSNPLYGLANPNTFRMQTFQWNGSVSYEIIKGLDGKINIGLNQTNTVDKQLVLKKNSNPLTADISKSSSSERDIIREHLLIEPQLNYQTTFGNHRFHNLIGATFQKNKNQEKYLRGEGYFSESQVGNIALAENKDITQYGITDYRYAAVFGRIGYSYANKYYLNFTGRRDGSSRFGKRNRFGNFGAIGTAWDFYKEDFIIKNFSWLSYGKIRSSFGTSGTDNIGDYQYRDTYANIPLYPDSPSKGGLIPSKLHNPYYQWEKNTKFELTFDIGFFNDQVFLTTTWYKEKSSNQLINIALPRITGFDRVLGNFPAVVENTGLEFKLEVTPIVKNNFLWSSGLNISIPKNRLVSFPDLENSSYAAQFEIGKPLNIVKLFHYTGIDPETGKYTFEDVNKDGVLGIEDQISTLNQTREFFGGWYNNLQYKDWNVSFLVEFVKQKTLNPITSFGIPGTQANTPVEYLDQWNADNAEGKYQAFTQKYDQSFYLYALSDASVVNGSFIRLKSTSLSYQLPEKISHHLKIRNAKLYLNAQNLFTITPFKGFDPGVGDPMSVPALKSIHIGINFTI